MARYIVTNRKEYFEEIGNYLYKNIEDIKLPRKIAYDSETTDLKPHKGELFAMQLASKSNSYLLDLETLNINQVLRLLEDKILVGHNIKFDLGWLYVKYNFFPWKVRDTFLASKIIYNGLVEMRHNLGVVMERELGVILNKDEQKNIAKIKLSTPRAIDYSFNDVERLLDLEDALNAKIISGEYLPAYNLHCRWIRAAAYMEQCGVPISVDEWNKKIVDDKIELQEKENRVIEYIYDNLPKYRELQTELFSSNKKVNILLSSPKQMISVFNDFGVSTKDPDGKDSISEDIIKKSKHDFIKIWLDYQGIKHDVTTFGENFLSSIYEGRLYTTYSPIMDTARISAGGKNPDKTKEINTLNIPANKKSRKPFKANPGFKYLVADYAGQETVTGADITRDEAMIDSVVNDLCLHCSFARVLYPEIADLSDSEIKENHKDKRNASKAPRFCFQFGGSGFTLSQNEGIPLERGLEIEKLYRDLHKGVYEYGNKKIDEAINLGYIESTMGFKLHLRNFEVFKKKHDWIKGLTREFWTQYGIGKKEYKALQLDPEYKITKKVSYDLYCKNSYDVSQYFKLKSEYFRLCLNNPAQGTAAFQTKAATNKIFEHIYRKNHFWKARICLVVHDEINMEVADDLVVEYKKVIEDAMVNEGNKFLTNPNLFMSAETNIADNWYDAK